MGEAIVRLDDVVKRFGPVVAIDHVSIEVLAGEFFSVLGPSGCGKTTLLRSIAGLEEPDSGSIYLNGRLINHTPPYQRDVNTVFQNYALFPHMNVYENIAFGLKMKGAKKSSIDEKVHNALEMVGLPGMGSRKPSQLSGGQQQRIALARALVNEPSVLLLDEPLGALDLKLRKQMQIELKSLQKRLGITFIHVTHDQEESLTMSDRIAIMCAGKIEQVGSPSEVYEEPRTEFVANFIGISNLFSGHLRSGSDSVLILTTPDGLEIKCLSDEISLPQTATVMVRPEKIRITPYEPESQALESPRTRGSEQRVQAFEKSLTSAPGDVNFFRVRIEEIVYLGTVIQFIVNINDRRLVVLEKNYDKTLEFRINQEFFISWDVSSTVILPEKGIFAKAKDV